MEQLKKLWASIWLPVCNAFVAVLLALILIDAMPFSPPLLRDKVAPLMYGLGLKQGQWNMFGPNPDAENERLSAEIEYADGTVATWQGPDWRSVGVLRRFANSRRQEYLDNITVLAPQPATVEDFLAQQQGTDTPGLATARAAWDGLADYAARHHGPPRPDAPLVSVRLSKETAEIPDAEEGEWPSMGEPPAYGEKTLLHERLYP